MRTVILRANRWRTAARLWRSIAPTLVLTVAHYYLSLLSADQVLSVAWEKAANKALVAAKRQSEEHPNDQRRAKRYEKLKQDYKVRALWCYANDSITRRRLLPRRRWGHPPRRSRYVDSGSAERTAALGTSAASAMLTLSSPALLKIDGVVSCAV